MSQCLARRRAVWCFALLLVATGPVVHAADAVSGVTAADAGGAETDCDGCAAQHLAGMTVAATLNPRPVAQVAADVSVITRKDMDRHLVNSLRDLIRYEPGVSVTSTPGRYGQSGFSIRGLGGNRVRIDTLSEAHAFDPQDLSADNVPAKYVHRADSGRVDRLTLARNAIMRAPSC